MRKWLLSTAMACSLLGSTGCLIPIYSADPARRAQQLFYTSENLRVLCWTNGSGSGSSTCRRT